MMYQSMKTLNNPNSTFPNKVSQDFYRQLDSISNTIISLQYNRDKLLSFRVSEASSGNILSKGAGDKNLAIQCDIRGNIYNFTREHIEQLSKRECRELFKQLGITKTHLFDNN